MNNKLLLILVFLFSPGVSQAKSDDAQNQIIVLNDSAAALEDTNPGLSRSLAKIADEKQKEWEQRGGNQAKTTNVVIDKNVKQLHEEALVFKKAAFLIQPAYPLIAKSLNQMAGEIDKSIEFKK